MNIQIRTDRTIPGDAARTARMSASVEESLRRFSAQITRVEVHLSDENADKGGPDSMRCVMEVRLEGYKPLAVTHQAGDVDQAIHGASGKLVRLLDKTLARLRDPHSHKLGAPPAEADLTE